MFEASTAFAWMWTVATFIFSAGFGFAGIKYGQRSNAESIKRMEHSVKETRDCVTDLKSRLFKDENDYMRKDNCLIEQNECEKHRTYHEAQIFKRFDEIQAFMVQMDTKREKTKNDLSDKLQRISEEIAVLRDRNNGYRLPE